MQAASLLHPYQSLRKMLVLIVNSLYNQRVLNPAQESFVDGFSLCL